MQVGYYIDQDALDAAERFPGAVEDSIAQLREQPGMGAPRSFEHPALTGLRSWPVKGFDDIRIFYQVLSDRIRVLRGLHGSRDLAELFQAVSD